MEIIYIIAKFTSQHARDCIFESKSQCLGMTIYCRPFLEASVRPDVQDYDVGAGGGQGPLQGVSL